MEEARNLESQALASATVGCLKRIESDSSPVESDSARHDRRMPPSAVLAQSPTSRSQATPDRRDGDIARPFSGDCCKNATRLYRFFGRLKGPTRATASAASARFRTIARRRFHYRRQSDRAPRSIPIPCLPSSISWRLQAGRRDALEPGSLPSRWFQELADDALSPMSIRERLIRVGRPRPGAVPFPASLFVRRTSWRASQKPARPP